jgi:hypothetical protein
LYIKQTGDYILVTILYVDDLIILSSDVTKLKWLKSQFEKDFEMSDLGELNYCLGVQFQRDRKTLTITMSQTSYIEEMFRCFNMEDCKPVTTPSDANFKLLKLSDEEFGNVQKEMEGVPYKTAVGSFMYVMVGTRPNLAFAVSTVSQFMAKAGPSHWMAVKRILRYLKVSLKLKLSFGGNDISLVGFCDADWMGDTNDRRSTTGYVFIVGREPFCGNARNNPPLHCPQRRRNTWLLANIQKRRFGYDNYWRTWDMCKKESHPSCVITKVAYNLLTIPCITPAPNSSTSNTISLGRN